MDAEGKKEEAEIPSNEEIPREVQVIVKEEVERQLADIADDPEYQETIGDLYSEVLTDYAKSTYLILRWIDTKFDPRQVLYPGSGADRIPKTAFGEAKVIHYGLEEYWKSQGKQVFFDELGEGQKVVAEHGDLPFSDSSFQAILLLDAPIETVGFVREEAERVLAKGGLVILAQNVLMGKEDEVVATEEPEFAEEHRQIDIVEIYRKSPFFEEMPVPEKFQNRGASLTEFFIFRKTKDK